MPPTQEPPDDRNPFGKDITDYDLFQSQERCLREAIAQARGTEPEPLPVTVRQYLMLVYLGEMETHTLIEKINGMGLEGRSVWRNTLAAWKRLHGKDVND